MTPPPRTSRLLLGALAIAGLAPIVRGGVPARPTPKASAKDILKTEKPLYSQHNEEVIIRHFFHDQRGGTFVDVGCAAPIRSNNTYYLEKHLGWKGVGVDALPEFAQKWKNQRPASRFVNYIVTDHSGTREPFFRVERRARGISAIHKPTRDPGGLPVRTEEILVPTITLAKLLDDLGIATFDLLSMDIEGSEPLALAGFDIDRFRPRLVCIETKPKNRQSIASFFATHGYARIDRYLEYDAVNYYYAPVRERSKPPNLRPAPARSSLPPPRSHP